MRILQLTAFFTVCYHSLASELRLACESDYGIMGKDVAPTKNASYNLRGIYG